MKTKAVSEAVEYMSLNKALQYCGVSKCAWHYTKKSRMIPIMPALSARCDIWHQGVPRTEPGGRHADGYSIHFHSRADLPADCDLRYSSNQPMIVLAASPAGVGTV